MILYRFLGADDDASFCHDDASFCHKVKEAHNMGWSLHGNPTYVYDHANGVMRCGQSVVKETEGTYTPDMKLGDQ